MISKLNPYESLFLSIILCIYVKDTQIKIEIDREADGIGKRERSKRDIMRKGDRRGRETERATETDRQTNIHRT